MAYSSAWLGLERTHMVFKQVSSCGKIRMTARTRFVSK